MAMKKKPAQVSAGTVGRSAARWSVRSALTDGVKFLWNNMVLPCLLQPLRDHLQKFAGGFLRRHARRLTGAADPYLTITVAEYEGDEGTMRPRADAYEEAKAYLSRRCARAAGARSLRAERSHDGPGGRRRFVLSMGDGEEIADKFRGATVWWHAVPAAPPHRDAVVEDDAGRSYRISFHQRHRDLVVDSYLPHVCREGRAIIDADRRRKLFTNTGERYAKSSWSHVVFKHPSTFATLAMDPAKKKEVMDDLDGFRNGKEYYKRIGKAWKRGYLLYGPPGTGKSSMIAAMANYLDYHIYDIELTSVSTNTDLRKMFIDTKGKSIIVIEDIDCSLDLTGKRGGKKKPLPVDPAADEDTKKEEQTAPAPEPTPATSKVTLSGVLNFIDGLWSACGGERIIVFTTNHVDKLDPALIRSGRMDKHIEMSYCCFESFKFLAKNYLDVDAHHLFDDVRELLEEVDITPADVAELLTPKHRAGGGEDADSCLAALVEALEKDKEKAMAKKAKEEAARAMKAGGKKGKGEEEEVADDDVAELLTFKGAGDEEGYCLGGVVEVQWEAKETAMVAAKNASSDEVKEDDGEVVEHE